VVENSERENSSCGTRSYDLIRDKRVARIVMDKAEENHAQQN
jgi:hypothetical protein